MYETKDQVGRGQHRPPAAHAHASRAPPRWRRGQEGPPDGLGRLPHHARCWAVQRFPASLPPCTALVPPRAQCHSHGDSRPRLGVSRHPRRLPIMHMPRARESDMPGRKGAGVEPKHRHVPTAGQEGWPGVFLQCAALTSARVCARMVSSVRPPCSSMLYPTSACRGLRRLVLDLPKATFVSTTHFASLSRADARAR